MPIESLREADSYRYLRLREQIESRPTDSNSVYSSGETRPVFVYSMSGKDTFVVEGDDYKFYPAQNLPGRVWVKWETKPEIVAEREAEKRAAEIAEAAKEQKLKGSNWLETTQDVQRRNAQKLSAQYSSRHPKDTAAEAQYSREVSEREAARQRHAKSRI